MNIFEKPSVSNMLFGNDVELLPSVTEIFELELAHLEYNILSKEELIKRGAFFKSVNNQYTQHFLLYSGDKSPVAENRSLKTKQYFENGQFSTGYATHGLFPYRGKFHPQLIKGLLNILGIKKGETILDPMAGSGTANIEAALIGINSYAIDVSPFCQLMIQTKYDALLIDKKLLTKYELKPNTLFNFFSSECVSEKIKTIKDKQKLKLYRLSFLAYLDAMGYSQRVTKSNHQELFARVLNRYVETVINFNSTPYFHSNELGKLTVLSQSDALNISLDDCSIDCVITSPPYSFAIDYVENDKAQLEYLGFDIDKLKTKMIGLKGQKKAEKLEIYFNDMDIICSEIARVLKKGKYFVMIIGSNTNQTGGIRLENKIIESSSRHGLKLIKNIIKPIKGIRNTMKDENILIFQKG